MPITPPPPQPVADPADSTDEDLSLDRRQVPAWQRLIDPVARLGAPTREEDDPHGQRFTQAGLRHRAAPATFYAIKVSLAAGLPLAAWLGLHGLSGLPKGVPAAVLLLGVALLGLWVPEVWLRQRTARRQRAVFEALPDAIDLLVVCLEAGLGLDAALGRVQRDMRLRSPTLAEELELLSSELRLGRAREAALRHLAARTGLEEVRLLVATLVQADRFGLGLADALRTHARDLRTRRQRRAEEAAAKIPVKLMFPLIFALFPALMVVLLGPAVIGLMRHVMPLMGGR